MRRGKLEMIDRSRLIDGVLPASLLLMFFSKANGTFLIWPQGWERGQSEPP